MSGASPSDDPDDGIQFGELRSEQPVPVLPPDLDGHYAVQPMGQPAPHDLPVFVDLDVWNELENHALSDTSVELGGVLLGDQATDRNGRAVVIVRDSLRARHYEATRGSFKFTHSTWSEITRERERLNPDLKIVGWYHTHPGWGIFLSDMDDFIHRNFFGRPLDVALVMDPCQDQRGWFQWDGKGRTRLCGGYFLFTSRLRALELEAAAVASEEELLVNTRGHPGRFDGAGRGGVQLPGNLSPTALILFWLAAVQTLLLTLVAVRMLWPAPASPAGSPVAAAQSAADLAALRAEHRVFRELAQGRAVAEGMSGTLADDYARIQLENEQLAAANLSHVERLRLMEAAAENAGASIDGLQDRVKLLEGRLAAAPAVSPAAGKIPADSASPVAGEPPPLFDRSLWYWMGGGLIGLATLLGGFWWWISRRGGLVGDEETDEARSDFELAQPRTTTTASKTSAGL